MSAQGSVFIALLYSTFWGIGPSGSIKLGSFQFFSWGPNPANKDPLGFYDPSTGEYDLYVGATANERPLQDDTTPATPLYADPTTPQEVLANDSSTYVIDIGANNSVTVYWWNPVTNSWEWQTPSGPVSEIVARTGDGDNTIIVNNQAPNTVQTDFTGAGGVQYNSDIGSTTGGTTSVPNSSGTGTTDVQTTTAQPGTLIGGNDIFESGGGSASLMGANGNDVLVGSADPTPGTTPADSINGGNGNDVIIANAGNDTINAGSGSTVIYAGAGNQTIKNQAPPQGLNGPLKPGDIPPAGSAGGADTMPAGNDTIIAGAPGSFMMPFGPGADPAIVNPPAPQTPLLPAQNISSGTSSNGQLVVVPGGQTNAVLINYEGVGPGTSTYDFVDGTNTINYGTLQSPVNVDLATGTATGPGIGTESLTDFNVIIGGPVASTLIGGTASQGSDSIYGGSGGDSIFGNGANDLIVAATATNPAYKGNNITGGTGNDTIYGGNGHDSIYGGSGNDSIIGGSGGSSIDGGTGDSTIYGGAGNDTLSAANGNNLIYTGDGNDQVTGRQRPEHDLRRRRLRQHHGGQRQQSNHRRHRRRHHPGRLRQQHDPGRRRQRVHHRRQWPELHHRTARQRRHHRRQRPELDLRRHRQRRHHHRDRRELDRRRHRQHLHRGWPRRHRRQLHLRRHRQ